MPFRMEFHADAIVSVVLIFLVSATETIGDTSALAASGLDRDVTPQEPPVRLPVTALSAPFPPCSAACRSPRSARTWDW